MEIKENILIEGDCLENLKNIPDNSISLILVDPPYNISKLNDNRDRSKLNSPIMRRESPLKYDFGEWDNKTREEFIEFTKSWLKECCRILKDGGTIISFFNKEDISLLGWTAKEHGIRTRTIMSWHKTNPVPSFRKVNYLSACEFLWIGSKGEKAWTFNFKKQKEMHNFFQTANKSSYGETSHPTEKPLDLIKHLIEIHTNEGDIVLDCFAGSGTTGVGCMQTGRHFLMIEKDKLYIEMIKERLKLYLSCQSLGNQRDTTKDGLTQEANPEANGRLLTEKDDGVERHAKELKKGEDGIPPKPKDLGILPTII